jgi:hypothetical protein
MATIKAKELTLKDVENVMEVAGETFNFDNLDQITFDGIVKKLIKNKAIGKIIRLIAENGDKIDPSTLKMSEIKDLLADFLALNQDWINSLKNSILNLSKDNGLKKNLTEIGEMKNPDSLIRALEKSQSAQPSLKIP